MDHVTGTQSPALLGDDKDAYEAELRQALAAANPSGRYTQVIRTEAIIVTRPGYQASPDAARMDLRLIGVGLGSPRA
ncbi:hypothetical protein ACNTMW_13920 [Planosporangium sp. 12N6]|uniref:hypothetical protein n=1 Tax=Planosporangium spinosum TaxID=3402278 RepID=UPI003CF307A5